MIISVFAFEMTSAVAQSLCAVVQIGFSIAGEFLRHSNEAGASRV